MVYRADWTLKIRQSRSRVPKAWIEKEGLQRTELYAMGLIGRWPYQQKWELEERRMGQGYSPADYSSEVHSC